MGEIQSGWKASSAEWHYWKVTDSFRAPLDIDAAARMWAEYLAAFPNDAQADPQYTVERFGDSARLADELLFEVTHGVKRATAELVAGYEAVGDPIPHAGSHWIACDGGGQPRVVIRTTEVRIAPFTDVDEAFARDEGEGDRTLESWRREHRRYWTRVCAARGTTWSENDDIVLERFALVWPPDLRD
jgi:uncharacterized protein YhfF